VLFLEESSTLMAPTMLLFPVQLYAHYLLVFSAYASITTRYFFLRDWDLVPLHLDCSVAQQRQRGSGFTNEKPWRWVSCLLEVARV